MCRSGHETGGTRQRRCTVAAHITARYDTARLMTRYGKRIAAGVGDKSHQWGLFMKHFYRYRELTGQEPTPPAIDGLTRAHEFAPERCSWMSDELLEAGIEDAADDPLATMAICAELDRRAAAQSGQPNTVPAQSDDVWTNHEVDYLDEDEQRWMALSDAEKEHLWREQQIAEGHNPITNPALRGGPTVADRMEQAKDDYFMLLQTQYLQASEACGGAGMLNERGYAKGIDPMSLFSGPKNRVEAYGSKELMAYFNSIGGRVTWSSFAYQRFGWSSLRKAHTVNTNESFGDVANVV